MELVKHHSQSGRLRKIEGQVRGVQKMVEDGRYCIDILTQIRAVQRALRKVEEQVLAEHLQSCVTDAIRSGTEQEQQRKLREVMDVFGKFG